MPRALSALAMARGDVAPLAFICSITGSTLAAFLASLSSLATTSRAFRRLQAASAAASCGRSFRLPLSISTNS